MILGRIKVKVENINRKYLYCRPLMAGNELTFPTTFGICHVVYVERSILTENIERTGEYWLYGIFNRVPNQSEFNSGFMRSKMQPISEDIYNSLKLIYPQTNHCFAV